MTDRDKDILHAGSVTPADRFDLLFRGDIVPGNRLDEVKRRVAERFRLDAAAADQLFSGSVMRMKRGVDKVTAERILQQLSEVGAIATIVANTTEPTTQDRAHNQPLSMAPLGAYVSDAVDQVEADELPVYPLDQLVLEPVGSNMIEASELPPIEPLDLDTSGLALE